MDENEFFREATLRICGNLEIEEAMFSTLQFLRKEMPLDSNVPTVSRSGSNNELSAGSPIELYRPAVIHALK